MNKRRSKSPNYCNLEKIFARIYALRGISSMLNWDASVMMPKASVDVRSEHISVVESLKHQIISNEQVGGLIQKVSKSEIKSLNAWQNANFHWMQREYESVVCVSNDLIASLSVAKTKCEGDWRIARAENDFKKVEDSLTRVVELAAQFAKERCDGMKNIESEYDALLDIYDPNRKSSDVDDVFSKLSGFIKENREKIITKNKEKKSLLFGSKKKSFDIEKQKKIANQLLDSLGFDRSQGRFDESEHPFSGGVNGDARMTTRYSEKEFFSSIEGMMHEFGHANYDMSLSSDWSDQPVGNIHSMGMHESQAMLWENHVYKSKEFAEFLQPIVRKEFSGRGKAWGAENLYSEINKVDHKNLIRVDADEFFYCAHIIMRYNLEKRLISGELKVKDLPDAWKKESKDILGIEPKNDIDGCMQDMHWYCGNFGYFPAYAFGRIISAQFAHAMRESIGDKFDEIKKGDFSHINQWLNDNIYCYASRHSVSDILKKVTGRDIDFGLYIDYLKGKYLSEDK